MKPFDYYWCYMPAKSPVVRRVDETLLVLGIPFEKWIDGQRTSVVYRVSKADAAKLRAVRAKPNSGDGPWNRLMPPEGWRMVPDRRGDWKLGDTWQRVR